MVNKSKIKINKDFFKEWSSDMAYVLGFIVADGCVIKRKNRIDSYVLNITSKDKSILLKIKKALNSDHILSIKFNSSRMPYNQLQICSSEICKDLINLGIFPRKTYHLREIDVSKRHFPDFVRGFFDGDGSVYIQKVNGTLQIKSGFVGASAQFMERFNEQICNALNIPQKTVHKYEYKDNIRIPKYDIHFYIDDSEKLAKFMYGNNPTLYLERKKKVFDKWNSIKRRNYVKKNYPSKIGWHLNEKIAN